LSDLFRKHHPSPSGIAYGLAAYLAWGFIAIYFKQIRHVPPLVVLANRVAWSVAFLGMLLVGLRQAPAVVQCFRNRRTLLFLAASTTMIAANWFTFIVAVASGHLVEASFGYFITPLASVLLAVFVLKERLRRGQIVAIALAAIGVGITSWHLGGVPLISLSLAISFSLYGLLRKVAPVPPLVGLSVETALLLPAAIAYLAIQGGAGGGFLDWGGWTAFLLALGGVITAVPLLWFAAAARRLPLATLGFFQYLAPTCQLLLAVIGFGEPFDAWQAASFGLIWVAIGVFVFDAIRSMRAARTSAVAANEPARSPQLAGQQPVLTEL
jgi:chloramphenicol-sensitive protein RarD